VKSKQITKREELIMAGTLRKGYSRNIGDVHLIG